MHIRLNRIQYPIYNLGPGKRIGIWMQGCTLACSGCINPSLWTTRKGKEVEITAVANQILEVADDYDGITFTGGEPFQQYEPLMALCGLIKRMTSLSIYTFSGYSLDELITNHPDRMFMSYLDYLMDGRYESELHDDTNTRGSSNQRLYKFIDGNAIETAPSHTDQRWSLNISDEGQVFMAGIPRHNELDMLTAQLKSVGIDMRFR